MRSLPLVLPALLTFLLPAAAFAQDAPVEPAVPAPSVPPPPGDVPQTGAPSTTAPPPDLTSDLPEEGPEPAADPASDNSPLARDGHPLAGYHNGLFYLRDYNDNFRLHVQGRAQFDTYQYAGPGVADAGLKATAFVRRLQPEISGELFRHWWFTVSGDFGTTALDNPKGATAANTGNPALAPDPATGLPPQTSRYASAQTPHYAAAAADVYVNYHPHPFINIQGGQFNAPFSMENRTSDKYTPFMERSLAVRAVGVPTNKELGGMFWGETPNHILYYSAGMFDGDGMNRVSSDGRPVFMTRAFVHPLATVLPESSPLRDLQIGASFRYGSKDKSFIDYDYSAMTTQGNYAFWSPVYKGAAGWTHIIPSGDQIGAGGEVILPILSVLDVSGEFIYIHNDTREAIEGYESTNTERFGDMKGYSYYAQVAVWPLGHREIIGKPGYENMPHVDFTKPDSPRPARALQLLAKWEQVNLTYTSNSRGGAKDAQNIDGDIKVNALSLGVNYWLTSHIRLTANYVLNMFPDSAPTTATAPGGPVQSATNRASAPGNTLAPGVNNDARDNANLLHEILGRVAVAF